VRVARAGITGLVRPLRPRNPYEQNRAASPLELFTDLCFVVAVSQAASSLHDAISAADGGYGALHFAMAFFGLFWAWLNFTWFGSAYDNDDLAYRLLTILQILGSLVYAAAIPRVFDGDFRLAVVGYVIMRATLVTQWVRVFRSDPDRRTTAGRYAAGVTVVQLGWVGFLWVPHSLGYVGFLALAACEMAVPAWAERPAMTPWHPHHIAERYSLFFIIVLGETILSSTLAIQAALDAGQAAHLVVLIAGGVPLVFSLWWLYFSQEDADVLLNRGIASNMFWGFGHYFVFSSAAAVGAGLAARVDHYTNHSDASDRLTALAVTLPTAVLVVSIYLFHLSQHDRSRRTLYACLAGVVVVLAGTFTAVPELVAGLACTALVAATVADPQNRLSVDQDEQEVTAP
jgi:low temperature requirement protein LtrA